MAPHSTASTLPDSGIVTCSACGNEVGTLGQLKQITIDRAREAAIKLAKDIFKGK